MATPLTLEEIETLGELLARIPDNFSAMEPDMLDGFLTALTLMKHPPEQADWLPYVFDSEGNPRALCRRFCRRLRLVARTRQKQHQSRAGGACRHHALGR